MKSANTRDPLLVAVEDEPFPPGPSGESCRLKLNDLKKNGYVLEQLFSPLIVHTTPEHAELMAICNPRQSDGRTARQRPGVRQPSGAFAGEPAKSPANAGGLDALGKADSAVFGPLLEKAPEGGTRSGTLRAVGEWVNNCASGVITKHHAHHYFGLAETQWKLFEKERPRRVKPLLYVWHIYCAPKSPASFLWAFLLSALPLEERSGAFSFSSGIANPCRPE